MSLLLRAVLHDVGAGVLYVLLPALLGLTARPSTDTEGLTAGFVVIGLLHPGLAGMRHWVDRSQFRPKDSRVGGGWFGWIPIVVVARKLIGPGFQARRSSCTKARRTAWRP